MLSVWDPFADLNRIQREFEKSYFGPRSRADFAPPVDVHEDAESLVLRAELPGVKKEDIDISVDANVLTLKGERKMEEKEEQGRRYHRVERAYGSFLRQFQLSSNVDSSKIDAQLSDGVLTLRLAKREELKPRRIDVKS
jgi:HSP20 family protein